MERFRVLIIIVFGFYLLSFIVLSFFFFILNLFCWMKNWFWKVAWILIAIIRFGITNDSYCNSFPQEWVLLRVGASLNLTIAAAEEICREEKRQECWRKRIVKNKPNCGRSFTQMLPSTYITLILGIVSLI